jgi:hypothetical protein
MTSIREAISHPALLGLYDHWRGLAPPGIVPSWRDFDPTAVAPCIGSLLVADLEADPFRVRYRLVGERLAALYGSDLTGRYVDKLYLPGFRARVLAVYRAVLAGGDARSDHVRFPDISDKFDYHRLMLPFRRGDGPIDRILVGIFPVDPEFRVADDWRYHAAAREFVRQLDAQAQSDASATEPVTAKSPQARVRPSVAWAASRLRGFAVACGVIPRGPDRPGR